MKKRLLCILCLCLSMGQVFAEKRYVTDRILLGIHVDSDETSILVKSVPSGTEMEILETQDHFVKVRLEDGTEGWANSGFLQASPPDSRKYDELNHKHTQAMAELNQLKTSYAKKERELEIRRDELSNAKTTIREMKKHSAKGGNTVIADPETENKLVAALEENSKLKQQIEQLHSKNTDSLEPDQQQILNELEQFKQQHASLQNRIEIAMTHLKGEKIPTAEELASIRPQFPVWYWTLLVVILIVGILMGLFFMDYHFRRRHGGFRI